MNIELPPQLAKLYQAFDARDKDVPLIDLYGIIFTDLPDEEQLRHAQQRLGPYITRLNRRLKGAKQAVRPGASRRTYRLTRA